MSNLGHTFSESWHRVAELKVGLRPTVEVRVQYFRGEKWYILQDPFNNQFYRFRPEAYSFICRLTPDKTVGQVWNEALELFPEDAPGQEDVIKLLTQLYYANLLYFTSRPDSIKIFERYTQRRQREIQSKLLTIMFMRIPLFDPDRILTLLTPVWRFLISTWGAVLWFAVIFSAGKLFIENWGMAWDQAQGVLSPGNIPLLYLALILIKTMHEFGHAAVCKRFGGEVHTMGVMLLVFTPLPYMDATSSWSFRDRGQRALVGMAGMLVEIILAAIAVFIWVQTGEGTLHSLAYNIMFIASVSTVLFNANPLLHFDGYYILSDWLDIPNLRMRAQEHLRHLLERYAFGNKESFSPTQSPKEATILVVFGICSLLYRVLIFTGIISFIADKFLIAGLILALICIISWVVVPIGKFFVYLVSSPRLEKSRPRAFAVSFGFFALLAFFLLYIPFPNGIYATGVLESGSYQQVVAPVSGLVEKIMVESGSYVRKGGPVLKLANRELKLDLELARAQKREIEVKMDQVRLKEVANLAPLKKRLTTIKAKIEDLQGRLNSSLIKAEQSGVWQCDKSGRLLGMRLQRGEHIGNIVGQKGYLFKSVVTQEEVARLFRSKIESVQVKLKGQADEIIPVKDYSIIPYEQQRLPSAALGWKGGGSIATSMKDKKGLKAREPFFLVQAVLASIPDVYFVHGRTGKIRIAMPHTPLFEQIYRSLKQVLQERYQL